MKTGWGVMRGATVVKEVLWSKHYCRKFAGWGFDAALVERWRGWGATDFEVRDLENGKVWRASMDTLTEHGIRATLNVRDGEQIFLGLEHWSEYAD